MSVLFPPDLWTRLARLDATCHVSVYSTMDIDPAAGGERFWVANARRRDNPARFVEVTGESMLEAMIQLLVAAERERFAD